MKLTKKPGAPTITIILIGIVHLVAFGWLAYSTDKMLYKIFFGVMGVLLFIGIVDKYGADTLRIYEMFLGPLEQSKPWDTNGIDGVHKFLRRLWRLFQNANNEVSISNDTATKDELKVIHKTIKKISQDIENFSFNTGVSAFMICVNELTDLKCPAAARVPRVALR